MIETKVPKDIRIYETKIVGPFTLRQAVCVILLVFLDILFYSYVITPFHVSLDNSIYMFCFLDLPIAAFGFIKIMGVPLEKYLQSVFISSVLSPVSRKAQIKCTEEKLKDNKKRRKLSKKEIRKHPEYTEYR